MFCGNKIRNPCDGGFEVCREMGKGRGPKQRVQLQVRCFPGLSRVSPGTCGGFRQRSVNHPDRRVNSQGRRGQGF